MYNYDTFQGQLIMQVRKCLIKCGADLMPNVKGVFIMLGEKLSCVKWMINGCVINDHIGSFSSPWVVFLGDCYATEKVKR